MPPIIPAISFQRPEILLLVIPSIIIIFLLVRADFVRFRAKKDRDEYNKGKSGLRMLVFILRAAAAIALIAAVAGPYTVEKKVSQGTLELKILLDNSRSFEIFDRGAAEGMKESIGAELPTSVKIIGEQNRSAIGDAIISVAEGDDSLLLISDGNNNYGKDLGSVALFAAMLNTTVNILDMSPVKDDVRVSVMGARQATAGTENVFEVYVDSVGNPKEYNLVVIVDDEAIMNERLRGAQKKSFRKSFSEGYHKIKAEISTADYFPQNNVFYKTVEVEPKPKVLLAAEQNSPLSTILSSLYELRTEKNLPSDISQYSAVVLDDRKMNTIDISQLREYTLNGNGVVVFGGKSSFDKDSYKDTSYKQYEAFLPVTVGAGKPKERKEVNVILVIDISGSTGESFSRRSSNTVEDVEKALAVSILGDLRKEDKVAVIAFNTNSNMVSELQALSQTNIPQLEDKISRLNFGGGTEISAGIEKAADILKNTEGSKNIILISDGNTGGLPWDEVRLAEGAAYGGVKIYTVGVGASTDSVHMKDIAEAGNGIYFEPDETERIKIIFGGFVEEQAKKDLNKLEIINTHHFITGKVPLSAEVSGFNFVIPKQNAEMLVATAQNNPIITVWRFGLGRIAVVSTDSGNSWSGQLYSAKNSLLIAKTVNWAIGDLSRNKEFDVDMKDTWQGEELEINVKSKNTPSFQNLNFTKTGENTYAARTTPREAGFYNYLGGVVAVNYERELYNLGANPEMENLAAITGGQIFKPEQTSEIIEKVKQDSKIIKAETVDYSWVLLASALIIFLLEIAIRRIAENKALNK